MRFCRLRGASAKIAVTIPPAAGWAAGSHSLTTATDRTGVYLKYALFCRETEEGEGDNLSFNGIIDLVDIPMPDSPPSDDGPRVLTEVDAHLAFCIAGANAGSHTLEVTIRAPATPGGGVGGRDILPTLDQALPNPGDAPGPARSGYSVRWNAAGRSKLPGAAGAVKFSPFSQSARCRGGFETRPYVEMVR